MYTMAPLCRYTSTLISMDPTPEGTLHRSLWIPHLKVHCIDLYGRTILTSQLAKDLSKD